ncbi:hypothetical protein D3C78_678210 [compost metagenome]
MLVAHLVHADLDLPVVLQPVLQGAEHRIGLEIPAAPVGARVERAAEVELAVIAGVDGVARPGGATRLDVLVVESHGQQGVRIQVGFKDAVEHILLLRIVVQVGVAVLVGAHEATTQGAFGVERAGHVTFGTVVVPVAGKAAHGSLEVMSRALAHQVDGGRRVAGAGHQAGGALDDFDAVVDGHVDVGGALVVDAVVDGVDAVVLVVGDGEAAGGELHAVAVVGLHGYARGVLEHVADVGGGLVVHHLAGDHGDRLRGFADRQRQLGGGAGHAGGVGAGAFGGFAEAGAVDAGRRHFQGAAVIGRNQGHGVAVDAVAQPAAGEDGGQGVGRRVVAARAGAAAVGHVIGAVEDLQVGLLAELAQGTGEGLRRDVQADLLGLHHGGEGQCQCHAEGGCGNLALQGAMHQQGLGEGGQRGFEGHLPDLDS